MAKLEEIQEKFGIGTSEIKEEFSPLKGLKLTMVSAASYGSGVSESVKTLSD